MQNTRAMLIIKKQGKEGEPKYITNINNMWYNVSFGRKIDYTQSGKYQMIIVEEGTYKLKNWKPAPDSEIERNYCDIYEIVRICDYKEKINIEEYNKDLIPF